MKRWEIEKENALREYYGSMPAETLADRLGVSVSALRGKAHRLGVKKIRVYPRIKLSKSDEVWLKLNYPHIRNELCAMHLGLSLRTLSRMAKRLNLTKTPEFMRECHVFSARKMHELYRKVL